MGKRRGMGRLKGKRGHTRLSKSLQAIEKLLCTWWRDRAPFQQIYYRLHRHCTDYILSTLYGLFVYLCYSHCVYCPNQFTNRTTPPCLYLNTSAPRSKGTTTATTGLKVLIQLSSNTSRQSSPEESTAGSPEPVGGRYSNWIDFVAFFFDLKAARRVLNPDDRL